jgi:YegS/Rv2252/BmrU family lipid kinase
LRVTLVYNSVSGGGTGRAAAERTAEAFRAAGHDAEPIAWEAERGASQIAFEAAESGADRVVAVGGDGTAVDVAAGLLAASRLVPMAHVPRGTANVLALNLGIPNELGRAIAVAVGGVEARIDVGEMRGAQAPEGRPFLLSLSTGLQAEMVERADRAAKRRWGVLAYLGAGWPAIGVTPRTRYHIRLDGEAIEAEGTMIQVMNMGAVLRRSWRLAPGISPVDGKLDVIVYRATTLREYLAVMSRVVQGRPTATDLVLHRSAAHVAIDAEPVVPVQLDGEIVGLTPARVEVRPRALAVIVPARGGWPRSGDETESGVTTA